MAIPDLGFGTNRTHDQINKKARFPGPFASILATNLRRSCHRELEDFRFSVGLKR